MIYMLLDITDFEQTNNPAMLKKRSPRNTFNAVFLNLSLKKSAFEFLKSSGVELSHSKVSRLHLKIP